MKQGQWKGLVVWGLLVVGLGIAQAPAYPLEGKVTYRGSHALASWEGVNTTARGSLTWNTANGVLGGEICIQTAGFDSGIGLRDRDARELLEVEQFPRSCFRPSQLNQQGDQASVIGRLNLRGREREVKAIGRLIREGSTYRFVGSFATRFTDWGMNPPNLIVFRVNDEVEVTLEARITRP